MSYSVIFTDHYNAGSLSDEEMKDYLANCHSNNPRTSAILQRWNNLNNSDKKDFDDFIIRSNADQDLTAIAVWFIENGNNYFANPPPVWNYETEKDFFETIAVIQFVTEDYSLYYCEDSLLANVSIDSVLDYLDAFLTQQGF